MSPYFASLTPAKLPLKAVLPDSTFSNFPMCWAVAGDNRFKNFFQLSREPLRGERGIIGMSNPLGEPDDELIRRAKAGELSAFQTLAERHAETLCRCAMSWCRDRQLAEDIAQETLVEAWRSLAKFDGRCRFSTWMYGILRHRFWKARRRRLHVRATPLSAAQGERVLPSSLGPESLLLRAEEAERVRLAVAELPDEHRQVIELRFFAGASLNEIVTALDVPLGTVKSRLHNGLEKLRQQNLVMNLFPTSRQSPARQS